MKFDDTLDLPLDWVAGLDENVARWRTFSRMIDEWEAELAAARWPQQMVRGLTNVFAEQIKKSEDILDLFDQVAGQVEPGQLVPFPQRERDLWLWAAIHLIVARTAEKVMWQAAGQRFPETEDERRAICEAFLAVWRLAPILGGVVMSDFPDEFATGRASLVLSSWLAARVKSGGALGKTTELHQALTEDGAQFWPSLLDRLPGAVVTAWSEFQERARTPTPGALLNRATYLLQCEGRQQRVRAGGVDRLVTPEPLPDEPSALTEDDETAALLLRLDLEEAQQAVLAVLTPREAEFWSLDFAGYSDAEIAEHLDVKIGTVANTLSRVRRKIERWRSAS